MSIDGVGWEREPVEVEVVLGIPGQAMVSSEKVCYRANVMGDRG